ncbi:MAG: hypothetical protein EAX87_01130 [Candidatus Thorarchaeota archaeon]|nr:hypothetical protein [Candidatus Thorarchaeota archaeon]
MARRYTMFSINEKIRANRSLYWAGIIQTLYGFFELSDVVAAVMIAIGLIPNIYGQFIPATTEVGKFMETTPAIFIAIFFFFASLRVLSGYWILLNRAKGFWMAVLVSGVSLVAVWFLLPLSALDLCIILPVLILLFKGYFRDSPIVPD